MRQARFVNSPKAMIPHTALKRFQNQPGTGEYVRWEPFSQALSLVASATGRIIALIGPIRYQGHARTLEPGRSMAWVGLPHLRGSIQRRHGVDLSVQENSRQTCRPPNFP